jgi:prophage antirepressor-like protein
MNDLIVKEFNGKQIHTFIWNGKPCWIANEIVSMFDYVDPSATISQCIESEEFEPSVEYEVLTKEDLKIFKNMINELTKVKLVTSELLNKYASSVTIFYEDGLYGFLQYTDKPIGVKFRKWIRREVLPEIHRTGAYISDKANPEMLRKKANEIENMSTLNETAKILLSVFEEAGLKPQYKALAMKQIYRCGGIDLPIEEIKADKELYDLQSIAVELGVYSTHNKPHKQAIGYIISQIEIDDSEKEIVSFENNGHMGTTTQYTRSVIEKVRKWILDNGSPTILNVEGKNGKSKNLTIVYNKVA